MPWIQLAVESILDDLLYYTYTYKYTTEVHVPEALPRARPSMRRRRSENILSKATPSLPIRILGRLALLLLGMIAAIGILEVAARIAWKDVWQDPLRDPPPEEALEEIDGIMRLASRNVRGTNGGVFYRTNEHGVRSRNHSKTPDDGVFRVLLAGDSVAMGSGVLEEHRFSNLLDGSRHDEDGPEYEFVNIALSGLNSNQVMNRIERLLPYYESDLFMYGFTVNDILGRNYRSQSSDEDASSASDHASALRDFRSQAERSPSYLLRYAMAFAFSYLYDHGFTYDDFQHNYFENEAALTDFYASLDRFASIANQNRACGVVLILTHLEDLTDGDHHYAGVYDLVADAAEERGLMVIESLSYFEGRDEKDLWVSLFDSHPNREGHEIFARALEDGLEALPSECFER